MKNTLQISVLFVLLFSVLAIFALQISADGDYHIYDLNKIEAMQSLKNIASDDKVTGENGAVVQRFMSDGTNKNAYIELTFFEDGETAPFDFDKYPIVVVSGRSNIMSTTKRLQINAGLKITTTGKYERCWGLKSQSGFGDENSAVYEKLTKFIIDLKSFSGYSGGEATYANVEIEAGMKYLRILPWATAKDIKAGEYFELEYVGFFKTEKDAEKYVHTTESGETSRITLKDNSGKAFAEVDAVNGTKFIFPKAPELEGYVFLGYTDENGKIISDGFTVEKQVTLTATYREPYDLNDYIIYTADQFEGKLKYTGNTASLYEEDGEKYIRMQARGSTGSSNYYVALTIFDEANGEPDFLVKDYPIAVIGYRTDIASSDKKIFVNAGLKIESSGIYERCWGIDVPMIDNGKLQNAVVDLSMITGSTVGKRTFSDVDDASGVSYIRIPAWNSSASKARQADQEYFDVKYIAFFRSQESVDSFIGETAAEPTYKITFKDRNGKRLSQTDAIEGTNVVLPKAPAVEDKVFTGWIDDDGNIYTQNFKATADLSLTAYYEGDQINVYEPDTNEMYGFTLKALSDAGLVSSSAKGVLSKLDGYIEENGNTYVRFVTPEEGGVYDSKTYININLLEKFRVHEYPYLAIGYKSSIVTKANWGVSLQMMNDGAYTRFWGLYPPHAGGNIDHKAVMDIREVTGSDAGADWTGVDKGSDVKFVRITPWGKSFNTQIYGNQFLDLQYIAFFKTKEEAEAFEYTEGAFSAKAERVDAPFIKGYDGFEFRPENNMTRAEACTVVTRLLVDENTLDNSGSTAFTDLDKNAWYYKYITYLEGLGYLKSYTGQFKPDQKITRAEFVELVYNMGKISGGSNEVSFKDVPQAHPRYNVIMAAAKAGLVNGKTKDTFDPDGDIKRSEVVKVLCIALGRTPTVTGIENTLVAGFSDMGTNHWAYPYVIEAAYEHELAINEDGSELWLSATDDNFYMKKASDELIASLEKAFEDKKNEVLHSKSEWTVAPGGKVWYVSNDGNDSNDGLSEKTPLATLTKVEALQKANSINAGDVVLLKRGDEWHHNFVAKSGVTYSAYGEGAKPRILGSIEADNPEQWLSTDKENLYKFYQPVYVVEDVGQIVFNDGEAYGMRVIKSMTEDVSLSAGTDGLVSNGIDYWYFPPQPFKNAYDLNHHLQFYHDWSENALYLYCEGGNPGDLFDSIEIAKFGKGITAGSDVIIDNICVRYTGSHGIWASSCENFTVRNCEVGWIGGSCSNPGVATNRLGNAVEVYGTVSGFYVYDNYMHNCFDCGPTVQLGATLTEGKKLIFENVEIRDNALWDADLEVWLTTTTENTPTTYAKIINCKLSNNLVTRSGYGFSGYNHQKYGYTSFYGAGDTFTEFIDCSIENNKFWNTRKYLFKATATSVREGLGFAWKNNTIILPYGGSFGQLGKNPKEASGGLTDQVYNNATVKQLLGNKAIGFNDYYYTLAEGQSDPAV